MNITDLKILRNNLDKKITITFVKEDPSKVRMFAKFLSIIGEKAILSDDELKLFAKKYRDSIYGETFLDMLCILNTNDPKISDIDFNRLCKKYIMSLTSDEEEYRNMLEDVKTAYGDCNGFFSEEYIESRISKEKEKHFSSSVKELLDKGYTIDNIRILLEKNSIKEFDLNTKIHSINI